jgi:hypothetical protein
MNRTKRLTRESPSTTGAKAVSILFMIGMIALFVAHTMLPAGEDAAASASAAAQATVREVPTAGSVPPMPDANVAASAAKRADAPVATF